jgi:hypothetical protein
MPGIDAPLALLTTAFQVLGYFALGGAVTRMRRRRQARWLDQ